jgi:curved DNA-binding protein CbpA
MPKSQLASPYDIFHLSRTSSQAEIKARYYELVKLTHPDRIMAQANEAPSSSIKQKSAVMTPEKANEDFKRVREAYNILGNERKRRLYDRSGMGWDPVKHSGMEMGGFAGPVWKGGFPRTARERQEYEAWSSSLRRGAPGSMNRQGWEFRGQGRNHDRHGWQHYAGNSENLGSDWFYGYGHARDHANPGREPLYAANSRFFISLTFLTTILGIGTFMRVKEESRMAAGLSEVRHQSVAKSLDDARNFARSEKAGKGTGATRGQ